MGVAYLQMTNDIEHSHRYVVRSRVCHILGDQCREVLCREFTILVDQDSTVFKSDDVGCLCSPVHRVCFRKRPSL